MRRFIMATRSGLAVAALSAVVAFGCGDDDDEDDGDGDGNGQEDAGLDAGLDAGEDASAGEGGVDAGLVQTDGEIAAIVNTVNAGEIAQAQVALEEAQREDVQAYAQAMIDEHTAAQTRVNTLLTQEGITATPNAVSEALQSASEDIIESLNEATPAAFDLVYIQAQEQLHTEVLALIEEQLIPVAENEELRSELETLSDAVEEHRDRAADLLAELTGDGGVDDSGVDDGGVDDGGVDDGGVDDGGVDDGGADDGGADGGEDAGVDSGP